MAETICKDVVTLVAAHPLRSISDQSRLSQRLAEAFSGEEKQMFLMNFYMYLNFHKTEDYIVKLDEIYVWLGYTRKDTLKDLLVKYFTAEKDYKNMPRLQPKRVSHGGHNKENIIMNIHTFKRFCLLANTKNL
jgi:hypothetical protein